MKQLLLLVFTFLVSNVLFAQEYIPSYNNYYSTEIESLNSNYNKGVVKRDVSLLQLEWLVMVRSEKKELSKYDDESKANKLAILSELEKKILAGINGEDYPAKAKQDNPILTETKEEKSPESLATDIEEAKGTSETLSDEELATKLKMIYNSEIEGVYFRIQVAATYRKKTGREVQNLLNLKEEVIEEENSGLFKYLICKFSKYNTAKMKVSELKENSKLNAFVVGYKNDKRVPFNEIFIIE